MKKILNIEGNHNTPTIILSKNSLIIKGKSVQEDKRLFEKLLEKLQKIDKSSIFTLTIYLEYINTLTSHYLLK